VLLLGLLVLLIKVAFVVMVIILLRWALPRFRFDQLMGLAWKGLIPLALINLVGVAIVLSLGLPKHLLIATAVLPVLAAYYSAAKFNASLNSENTLRKGLSPQGAVSYE
jgi:NADH-quinone oxidoreductase subunit H